MILTNEQADKIYAAFGLNGVAVKAAVREASQAVPHMSGQDSHVLALVLGWLTAHENDELADAAKLGFDRLQEMVREEGNPPTHQEGGV